MLAKTDAVAFQLNGSQVPAQICVNGSQVPAQICVHALSCEDFTALRSLHQVLMQPLPVCTLHQTQAGTCKRHVCSLR